MQLLENGLPLHAAHSMVLPVAANLVVTAMHSTSMHPSLCSGRCYNYKIQCLLVLTFDICCVTATVIMHVSQTEALRSLAAPARLLQHSCSLACAPVL
jgi:hypothetical protein